MENHEFLQDLDFMQEITSAQIVEFLRGESLIEQPTMAGYIQAQEQEELIRDDVGGGYGVPIMSTPELLMVEPGVVPTEANMVGHGGPQYPLIENWEEGEQEEKEGEHSSGTTNVANCRSRTLVTERKRRGRMKEKLYALRALVPNITKVPFSYMYIAFALLD